MRRILLYKTGDTAPEVVVHVGDYHDWFARVLDGSAALDVHVAYDAPFVARDGFDGVIITGSPSSLVEPTPWMLEACEWLRVTAARGTPILGVCFGHQLVGTAWGARVRVNPRGWEAGSHEVELTDEGRRDPLFAGLPARFAVNQSHRDEVEAVPDGARRLARGDHSEVQSLAVGDHVRGVQFHPEMRGAVIRRIVETRHAILLRDVEARGRDGRAHPDAILAGARDTPLAEQVIRNFFANFVEKA